MAAAQPTCFVHIGAPKTGTTLLQKMCFENRARLSGCGLLYPDVSLRGFGHHDLAFLAAGGYPEWAVPQARSLSELTNELKAAVSSADRSVLLSSENFYLCGLPQPLHDVLRASGIIDRFAVTIIVYLRRQDDAHESWYNQTIKAQGSSLDLEECIDRFYGLWDYRANLALWEAAFGRDAMSVRVYDLHRFRGGSLINDFFSLLGVDPGNLSQPVDEVNGRINADLLEFQRLVNRLPLSAVEKRRYHKELIALTEKTAGTGLFDEGSLLSPERKTALMDAYAEGNADVAQRYFGRPALFATPETAAPYRERIPMPLNPEKLVYILGWLLARDR